MMKRRMRVSQYSSQELLAVVLLAVELLAVALLAVVLLAVALTVALQGIQETLLLWTTWTMRTVMRMI